MTTTALPKPGQIVTRDGRPYLVTLVSEAEPMGETAGTSPTHLVRLLSLYEDAFGDGGSYGEVSEIIWEEAPDFEVQGKPGLPDISSADDGNGCTALHSVLLFGTLDFIRQDMEAADPALEREINAALMDRRFGLETHWPQKKIEHEDSPRRQAVLAEIEELLGIDPDALGAKAEPGADAFTPGSSAEDYARRLKQRLKESRTNIETDADYLSSLIDFALRRARRAGITIDPAIDALNHGPFDFNHPLLPMATRLVRAQLWAAGDKKTLSGLCIGCVDEHSGGRLAAVHALLLVTGATGKLLHQEVIQAGVENGGYSAPPRVMDRKRLKNLLYLGANADDVAGVRAWFQEHWASYEPALWGALRAEVEARMKSLQGTLQKRRKERLNTEVKPLRKLAEETRLSIKTLLAALEDPDGAGAGEDPAFLEENLATFRAELEALEAEASRGAGEIKQRYNDPQAWLIPATMEILEPRNIDHMF